MNISILVAALGISARFGLVTVEEEIKLFRARCEAEKKPAKQKLVRVMEGLAEKAVY